MGSRIGNVSSAKQFGSDPTLQPPTTHLSFLFAPFFFPCGLVSRWNFLASTLRPPHRGAPPHTPSPPHLRPLPHRRRPGRPPLSSPRLAGLPPPRPPLVARAGRVRGIWRLEAGGREGARPPPPPSSRVPPPPFLPRSVSPHTGRLPARPLPWWLSRSQPLLLLLLLSRRVSWLALPLLSPPASRRASLAAAARG